MTSAIDTGEFSGAVPYTTDEWALPRDIGWVLDRVAGYITLRAEWLRYQLQRTPETDPPSDPGDYRDDPLAEAEWRKTALTTQRQCFKQLEQRIREDRQGRLAQLVNLFGLTREECDLLQTCIALQLEPGWDSSLGVLQNNASRNYITDYLVARLFGYGYHFPLSADSSLLRWGLVQEYHFAPGAPRGWQIDPQILRWLLGHRELHPSLVGVARLQPVVAPLSHWPVEKTVGFLNHIVGNDSAAAGLVTVVGASGSGRKTFAACVADRLRLPLLVIDTHNMDATEMRSVFVWAQRQAFLDCCALGWIGRHALNQAQRITLFPVQFVIDGPAIASNYPVEQVDTVGLADDLACHYRVLLDNPGPQQKASLWRSLIPAIQTWPEQEFSALLSRHVQAGDIAAVASRGLSDYRDISAFINARQRHHLDGMAQVLPCPFKRADLIVSPGLELELEDFLFEARERDSFWQDGNIARLFPRGQGLVALFSGPPGTGKTMAAQILAAELGVDLLRIDLSAVISKYVGETSQNLSRIIKRASEMDVVLLFDEADALFTKRTDVKDAHDRFANTDTNYLLQAIESYPGIAILATNRKANLDSAFLRRLRYLFEFNAPEYEQRLSLWQHLLRELAGTDVECSLAGDIQLLARQLSITGAQIKFAILAALLIARRHKQPLDMTHLLRGIHRELSKEGRGLSKQEQNALRKARHEQS